MIERRVGDHKVTINPGSIPERVMRRCVLKEDLRFLLFPTGTQLRFYLCRLVVHPDKTLFCKQDPKYGALHLCDLTNKKCFVHTHERPSSKMEYF